MATLQPSTKRKYGELESRRKTNSGAATEVISSRSNEKAEKRSKLRGKTEGTKGLKEGRNRSLRKFSTGNDSNIDSSSESEIDIDNDDEND